MAPQIDYTIKVLEPISKWFGISFDCQITRRGYFPKGGGEIIANINPLKSLNAVDKTDHGKLVKITGSAFVAGVLPIKMSNLMADSATSVLRSRVSAPINIDRYKETQQMAVGNGSGINLVAETSTGCLFGAGGLGKRDITPEAVGQQTAEELLDAIQGEVCLDSHAQDQVIIFMALAKGTSRFKTGKLTLHTQTAIHVAKLLTKAEFRITEDQTGCIIECDGIGLENQQV